MTHFIQCVILVILKDSVSGDLLPSDSSEVVVLTWRRFQDTLELRCTVCRTILAIYIELPNKTIVGDCDKDNENNAINCRKHITNDRFELQPTSCGLYGGIVTVKGIDESLEGKWTCKYGLTDFRNSTLDIKFPKESNENCTGWIAAFAVCLVFVIITIIVVKIMSNKGNSD